MLRTPELATLPSGAHPAAPLLHHTEEHGVLVDLPQGMAEEEKEAALRYETHASAIKESEFIHTKLEKQVQAGHVSVFLLEAANYLQNTWLSPVAVIPQVGRRPRLIFDFTWSGLNEATKRLPPMEVM